MEPITHVLTGACLSRAGLNRKTALATATMVLAAEIPDVDVVRVFAQGRLIGFAHHRGITHTFLGVPFDAALALAIVYGYWRLQRWQRTGNDNDRESAAGSAHAWQHPRWGLLYGFACLAALSHILLDFTNSYGVRPFAPFNMRWYAWDIVEIVEPLILLALLAGLVMPALFRLVGEEVSSHANRRQPRGQGGAIFALVFIVALWMLRDFEHRRAVADLQNILYQDEAPLRASAYPYMVNPFRWHGVVETQDFFALAPVDSSSDAVDPQGNMRIRYKPEETAVTLAAKKSYAGRVYLDWARYPMLEVESRDDPHDTYTVRIFDLRYAYPERSPRVLGCYVELDQNLAVVQQGFESARAQK